MNVLLTLAVGFAGGFAGHKTRIPAGSLFGSLMATAAFSILTGYAQSLAVYKIAAQVIAGIFIGMQFSSVGIENILRLWKPVLLMIVGMLGVNLTAGFLMSAVSDLDLKTALFGATPGGIAEISIISGEQGADALKVSLLQFARMLFALCVFPTAAQRFILYVRKKHPEPSVEPLPMENVLATPGSTAIIVCVSAVVGLVGYSTHICGMTLVFPMLAVALMGRLNLHAKLRRSVKRMAQMLSGIAIGSTVTFGDLTGLKSLLAPLCVLLLTYLVFSLALGLVLYRFGHLPSEAAFFSCIPAGMSDMALIASDYGTGGPIVAIMHLVRFACIMLVIPILVPWICN